MMEEKIQKAKQFAFNSLAYQDLGDLLNHKILFENEKALFLGSLDKDQMRVDWGANGKEDFFMGVHEILESLSKKSEAKVIHMEFIPEECVEEMEKKGFTIVNEWIDYWHNSVKEVCGKTSDFEDIREMTDGDYEIASKITQSCRGFSRGYEGETPEWIKEWSELDHTKVFLAEINNEIAGVCCVQLYGFDSDQGTIMWLREIAVKPEYHSRKIGYKLMKYALNWGKEQGAVRSFLACDVDNIKASRLYEGVGYKRKTNRGQINMQKRLPGEIPGKG